MLKQVNFTEPAKQTNENDKMLSLSFGLNAVFLLIQIVCSCLAGVYNEYLLKKKGANLNIFVQNVFMYLDSILCNLLLLMLNGDIVNAFLYENVIKIFHYKVLVIMMNNAFIGIVTSFFLKTLNSILKTFASALELVLTAILSYLFFSIPIYLNTIISISVVLLATYLYSKNPVQNVQKSVVKVTKDEQEELLQMEEV